MGRLIGRGGNSVGACGGGFGAHGGSLPSRLRLRGGVLSGGVATLSHRYHRHHRHRRPLDSSYLLSLVSTIQTPRAASSDNLGDPPPRRLSRQRGVLRPISEIVRQSRGGRPTGTSRSSSPGRDVVVAGRSDDESRIQVSDVVDYFINLPWQKLSSWLLVLAVASQLKEFLGITMGTFIVSFIGNSFVSSFQRLPQLAGMSPQKRRRVLVLVYYTGIGTLGGIGWWCDVAGGTTTTATMTLHALTHSRDAFVRSLCSSSLYIIRRADHPGRGA